MAQTYELIAAVDVGTTKVAAVVGGVKEDGTVDIVGVGVSPSHGIKKGVVVNVADTSDAIRRAVHEAELQAHCNIAAVNIGVSGAHLRSFNNRGAAAIHGSVVTASDVEQAIENARAVQIPADRIILHALPQEFLVDDRDDLKDPIGTNGNRLQVSVHIITALRTGVRNMTQCAERIGLHVLRAHSALLASSVAVLEQDEKKLGVVLVDIGGGTTDVAVYHDGAIVHSAVLPVGGDHITHDIAVGLRTPHIEAERVKLKYGCAISTQVDEEEDIDLASVGAREPTSRKRRVLCDIIELRVEEIFRLVEREIAQSNFADLLGSGVVVTGGSTLLPSIAEVGEQVLDLPVRLGRPRPIGGLYELVKAPSYS
ncbi:MAG: hypothetical protein RIT45_1158, partial [Pseudomonadota bacterium]